MEPLRWELRKIWPDGLLRQVLRACVGAGIGDDYLATVRTVHRNSLRRFKGQDKRSRKGRHWRSRMATDLYALLWAWRAQVMALNVEYEIPSWRPWMMLNCQPAGGRWTADRFEEGYTGKRCDSFGCPWCYMRRCSLLKSILLKDLGFKKNLSVVRIQVANSDQTRVREDRAMLTRFAQVLLRRGSTFKTALRVTAPFAVVKGGQLVTGHVLTYVHDQPYPPEAVGVVETNVKGLGIVKVQKFSVMACWKAVLTAYPYPAALLDARNLKEYYLLLRSQRGARVHGIVGKKGKNGGKGAVQDGDTKFFIA
ncbi:MAG: hypothetical protein AMXMBFR7_45600 [Planctomycetota bacterium]